MFDNWVKTVRGCENTDLVTKSDVVEYFADVGLSRNWTQQTAEKHRSALGFYYRKNGLEDPTTNNPQLGLLMRSLGKRRPKSEKLPTYSPAPLIALYERMPDNQGLKKDALLGKLAGLGELLGARMGDLITLRRHNILPMAGDGQEHNLRLKLLTKEKKKAQWAIRTMWGCPDAPKKCFHCVLNEYLTRVPQKAGQTVFYNPFKGQPLVARTLAIALDRQMRAAGIPSRYHPHSLRSAGATAYRDLLLGATQEVREQFGWSAGSTVPEKYYLKETPQLARFISESILRPEGGH